MALNFNIKSVLEAAAQCEKDQFTASIDDILSANDLEEIVDKACPITGYIAASLKEAAADPKQLRIVQDSNNLNEFYIDYNEFVNFCEAREVTPDCAVNLIAEAYEEEGIKMYPENIHIVFPEKSVLKEACACCRDNKIGYSADVVWSSKLLKTCIDHGIKTNTMYPKKVDDITERKSGAEPDSTMEVEEN